MDGTHTNQGGSMPPRVKSPVPLQHHLREWRKHRKMTLRQVANAIGSSSPHMSNVETGVFALTPSVATAAAQLFGISVEMLLHRKPSEATDLELDLLALFRGGDAMQRRMIVDMARVIRSADRRSVRAPDHEIASSSAEVEPG